MVRRYALPGRAGLGHDCAMSDDEPDLGPSAESQLVLRLFPYGDKIATYRQERFEREQRRAETLRESIEESLSMADLLEAMRGDERIEQMFRDAVQSAMASTSEDKIHLLGRAVATGALAGDASKIDEAAVLLRLASELDPVDLRALLQFSRMRGNRTQEGVEAVQRPVLFLTKNLGIEETSARPIVSRLQRMGLLEQTTRAGVDFDAATNDAVKFNHQWNLTTTAVALISLLSR